MTNDNKLIAEFMGMTPHEQDGGYMIQMTDEGNEAIHESSLLYHVEWNWLMPVVIKITRNEKYWEDDYREQLMDIIPYGHIRDVYDTVVGFIKEQNNG